MIEHEHETILTYLHASYQYDYHMNRNAEVRLDGIGAEATAQSNHTFENVPLNKLAKIIVRQVVNSKRKAVRKAMAKAKAAADDRKLHLREIRVEAKKARDRAEHARRLIEWAVEPHHTKAWYDQHPNDTVEGEKSIEEELKGASSAAKREELLKQNYHCIITGWGHDKYACCFSGNSTCSLCSCTCGGKTAFKSGQHMEVLSYIFMLSSPPPSIYLLAKRIGVEIDIINYD